MSSLGDIYPIDCVAITIMSYYNADVPRYLFAKIARISKMLYCIRHVFTSVKHYFELHNHLVEVYHSRLWCKSDSSPEIMMLFSGNSKSDGVSCCIQRPFSSICTGTALTTWRRRPRTGRRRRYWTPALQHYSTNDDNNNKIIIISLKIRRYAWWEMRCRMMTGNILQIATACLRIFGLHNVWSAIYTEAQTTENGYHRPTAGSGSGRAPSHQVGSLKSTIRYPAAPGWSLYRLRISQQCKHWRQPLRKRK